ncbi:MAG TPA: rubrerythrin family protein [Candidatus Aminicenantes bacterium]|nr:rubrerythrin family protein [Candidatus Aminicenantes bacterium]
MSDFSKTKTCENLMKAFAGESQARNRYTMYAKVAQKEGYEQIAAIFLETADNERIHAKLFFNHLTARLNGAGVQICATYPAAIGTTQENLGFAAAGEHEEWHDLYAEFARVAEEEGFADVARTFKLIAPIEKRHEERYLKLLERVQNETVFVRDGKVFWKCRECGHVAEMSKAPERCPVCDHPRAFFEIFQEV